MSKPVNNVDLTLSVLCASDKLKDVTFSQEELADLCGCTKRNIQFSEHSAIKKLRNNQLLKEYAA